MARKTLSTEARVGTADTNSATSARETKDGDNPPQTPVGDLKPQRASKLITVTSLQMNTSESNLAIRLLYLPLDLNEKVLLWLSYRELKPVSALTTTRRNLPELRQEKIRSPYSVSSHRIKRVKKWIRSAGLFHATEPKNPSSWHVGKNKDKVALSAKIIYRLDYQSEVQSGLLFGYPEMSVKAYARNQVAKLGETQIPIVWPGHKFFHPFLKDKYYTAYLSYAIRSNRIKEDSRTAKLWADTIRSEVPILAGWYETAVASRQKEESKFITTWKTRIKRDNQTPSEIIAEYSQGAKSITEILLNAVSEFTNSHLGEFQFASICYLLKKRALTFKKKDKQLAAILALGESVYVPTKRLKPRSKIIKVRQLADWYNRNKPLVYTSNIHHLTQAYNRHVKYPLGTRNTGLKSKTRFYSII